jgi:hypothetical protein
MKPTQAAEWPQENRPDMAEPMPSPRRRMRLLGFAPLHGLAALQAALDAIPGPAVQTHRGPAVAALLQAEPAASLFGRTRRALLADLHTVQRRLEVACLAGPFLPMNPAAACCPEAAVPPMLAAAWEALAVALARHGTCHQWDIALRWPPQTVVARCRAEIAEAAAGGGPAALADAVAAALRADRGRREAALVMALAPVVLAFAPGGAAAAEAELAVTILVEAGPAAHAGAVGGVAAVEAALEALPAEHVADAVVDLRGPLPPLSFASVRLAETDAEAVEQAWWRLDLPHGDHGPRIDAAALHRQWRNRAAAVHPDSQRPGSPRPGSQTAPDAAPVSLADVTDAYHLLRALMCDSPLGPTHAVSAGFSLSDLQGRAGLRLIIPRDAADQPPPAPALPRAPAEALS